MIILRNKNFAIGLGVGIGTGVARTGFRKPGLKNIFNKPRNLGRPNVLTMRSNQATSRIPTKKSNFKSY